MSDAKLRELERRWRETGSPDDEAAYLLERVRVGDLTQERLELAAYCGHEGARRAVADAGVGLPGDVTDRVLGLIERGGFPMLALGISAGVRRMLSKWKTDAPLEEARAALDAVDAWATQPSKERLAAVDSFATGTFLRFARRFPDHSAESVIARAVNGAVSVVLETRMGENYAESLPRVVIARIVAILDSNAWPVIGGRVAAFALGHGARE